MKQNRILLIGLLILTAYLFNSCDAHLLGVTITPKAYDFSYVETSKTIQFQLYNNSTEQIDITSAGFIGGNSDKFRIIEGNSPYTIYPKVPKYMKVEFTPDGFGPMQTTLQIKTSFAASSLILVKLNGYGLIMEFQPRSHDFGVVEVGNSESTNFTIINNTFRDTNINSFGITGIDAAHFSVVSGSPGILSANGGSRQITVKFAPFTHGPKSAQVTAFTSDSIFAEVSAELTGEGNVTLEENFDNTTMCDTTATTAEWGTATAGELTPTGLSSFGTGLDGAYNPSSSGHLDADAGPYNYTSINIPAGVVITVTGSQALEIYCQGDVVIDGELNLDGQKGANAPNGIGGAGGPGGEKGGDGGSPGGSGTPGSGGGGGQAAVDRPGGGGGFAVKGQDGFYTSSATSRGAAGGAAYGNPEINPLIGGSGGGGGAGYSSVGGAAGGGGGGAVLIIAGGNINLGGLISANGGRGGGHQRPQGSTTYGGGGGSGGAVKLISGANINFTGGSISVQGGMGDEGTSNASTTRRRGGYGSPGRVRLEDSDGVIEGLGGSIYPIPSAAKVTTAFTGGTGTDGAFNPTSNITLDTSNGAFNYTSVDIPAGVIVTATGTNPLEIYCTGDIIINGTIDISGGNGANGNSPGIGVAGGGDGGAGGDPSQNGTPGKGMGGGHEGVPSNGNGSSGGGFGTKGQDGSRSSKYPGGAVYGNSELNPLYGGSGGGGGSGCHHSTTAKGGGGGAGGGAIRLQSATIVNINGSIISDGGEGGAYGGTFSLPGSGGSGGGILIQGNIVLINGTLSARGNKGKDTTCSGGYSRDGDEAFHWQAAWGGDGRIRLEAFTGNIGGIVYSTKGKFASPNATATNPLFTGTCSISKLASINAGVFAQSKFFDSTLTTPTWQNANITGTDLTQVKVVFQSADDDGNGNPDPLTYTAWYDNLASLPQKQHVRFRVYFKAGSVTPSVDKIELLFN